MNKNLSDRLLQFAVNVFKFLKTMPSNVENNYWLKILEALQIGDQGLLKTLMQESHELKLILGSKLPYNRIFISVNS